MRRLFFTLILCLLTTPVWAAPSCVSLATPDAGSPPADPQTLAITATGGGVLIVHVAIRETDADNGVPNGVTSSTGGTFNLYGNNVETGGVDILSYVYYATDYASGAQTLSADYTVSTPSQGVVAAIECTDVNTGSPWLGVSTTTQTSSTSVSIDVTCQTGSLAVDFIAVGSIDSGAPVEGANQTPLHNTAAGGVNFDAAASYEAGASTNTMSWSAATNELWGSVGGCLVPPDTAAFGPLRRRF